MRSDSQALNVPTWCTDNWHSVISQSIDQLWQQQQERNQDYNLRRCLEMNWESLCLEKMVCCDIKMGRFGLFFAIRSTLARIGLHPTTYIVFIAKRSRVFTIDSTTTWSGMEVCKAGVHVVSYPDEWDSINCCMALRILWSIKVSSNSRIAWKYER